MNVYITVSGKGAGDTKTMYNLLYDRIIDKVFKPLPIWVPKFELIVIREKAE